MRRTLVIATALAISISAGTGCAASGGSATGSETIGKSSPDRLTTAEMESVSGARTAYDLVLQLRPRWLQVRSTGSISRGGITPNAILVYLDGNRMGTAEALKAVSAKGLATMRFLDAAQAAMELRQVGSEPMAGAIVIKTQ